MCVGIFKKYRKDSWTQLEHSLRMLKMTQNEENIYVTSNEKIIQMHEKNWY